jgi:hypothetical protein
MKSKGGACNAKRQAAEGAQIRDLLRSEDKIGSTSAQDEPMSDQAQSPEPQEEDNYECYEQQSTQDPNSERSHWERANVAEEPGLERSNDGRGPYCRDPLSLCSVAVPYVVATLIVSYSLY